MPKKNPDTTILHVEMPNEEFDALSNLRGPRKWRDYFWSITEDARKAAEGNQHLRERVEFLEEQLRRERNA